ncbi:MAG: hypothetical protein EXS00_08985 [Phycisphaerales bacterium]|nr:hypothetical protein [Phycisphaerales bacterium]
MNPFTAGLDPGAAALLIVLQLVLLLAHIACTIWFSAVIARALQRVAAEYRYMPPGSAWLRLLSLAPCIGAIFVQVFDFFLLPRTSRSLARAFAAGGDSSRGDCGERLAWTSCILTTLGAACASIGGIAGVVWVFAAYPLFGESIQSGSGLPPEALPGLFLLSASVMIGALAWLVSMVVFLVWIWKINKLSRAL